MTVALWRIACDTKDYLADDLSGAGAESTGGRWNRPRRPVVYATCSVALACVETLAHLNVSSLALNRYLVRIDVPGPLWEARETRLLEQLPVGWDAIPEGKVSLDIGDAWLSQMSSLLLLVPSVMVPEEYSVLINPRHPDAPKVIATKVRKWLYDARLRGR